LLFRIKSNIISVLKRFESCTRIAEYYIIGARTNGLTQSNQIL